MPRNPALTTPIKRRIRLANWLIAKRHPRLRWIGWCLIARRYLAYRTFA